MSTERAKPGSRAAVEQALKFYGLRLDSYRPGNVRLYAVERIGSNGRLSDRMEFNELKNWVRGYVAAKEGEITPFI
jgi:hypothetical protein